MSASGIRAGRAFIEIFGDDTQLRKDLRRIEFRLKSYGRTISNTGRNFLKMGGAMAAPLIGSSKAFMDFERQMANVSTMLDDPQKHMGNFRKEVRRMSKDFGESTEFLAQGLYDILSASVPAEKAIGVLEVAVKAAKAGMTETGIAADAITTILNSYGLEADKAADVSDLLFSAVKRGKTTFAELAPAIGNVTTIAASAGVSLDEVTASLAFLTRNGIKTDEAVTSVRAIIQSFLKPSKEAAETAESLGFSMNTATLQAEGLYGVFERLRSLDPETVAQLFPNVRALKGVLPALKALEDMQTDLEVMENRAGRTEEAFKKISGTTAYAFDQTKESIKDLGVKIGEQIEGPLRQGLKVAKEWILSAIEWVNNNGEIVRQFVEIGKYITIVGAGLLALGAPLAGFGFVVGGISTAIGALGAVAAALGTTVASLAVSFGAIAAIGLAPVIYMWVEAMKELNKQMEIGRDLSKQLEKIHSTRQDKRIKQIQGIEDPNERINEIEDELFRIERNVAGQETFLANGNPSLEERQEIKDRIRSQQAFADRLREELQRAEKELEGPKHTKAGTPQVLASVPVSDDVKAKSEAAKAEKDRERQLERQLAQMAISRELGNLMKFESGDTSGDVKKTLEDIYPKAESLVDKIDQMIRETQDREITGETRADRLQAEIEKQQDLGQAEGLREQVVAVVENLVDQFRNMKEKEMKAAETAAKKAGDREATRARSAGTFNADRVSQLGGVSLQKKFLMVQKAIEAESKKTSSNTKATNESVKRIKQGTYSP